MLTDFFVTFSEFYNFISVSLTFFALKFENNQKENCEAGSSTECHHEREKNMIHCTSIDMLLEINLSSSTKEWQISPQAQDQCIIWFNLCLQQIETNQVVILWSIRTFNGDKLSRSVAAFVTELIIFIREMKPDPFCNDFFSRRKICSSDKTSLVKQEQAASAGGF